MESGFLLVRITDKEDGITEVSILVLMESGFLQVSLSNLGTDIVPGFLSLF